MQEINLIHLLQFGSRNINCKTRNETDLYQFQNKTCHTHFIVRISRIVSPYQRRRIIVSGTEQTQKSAEFVYLNQNNIPEPVLGQDMILVK